MANSMNTVSPPTRKFLSLKATPTLFMKLVEGGRIFLKKLGFLSGCLNKTTGSDRPLKSINSLYIMVGIKVKF